MIKRIVHVKRDAYDVYIGRAMPNVDSTKTKAQFGNPYKLGSENERAQVLTDYFAYLLANPQIVEEARRELKYTEVLACWCAPVGGVGVDDRAICHGQILSRAMRGDYSG